MLAAQSCPTLRPHELLPPGFSAHGIPRQEYWSRLLFPSPGDLPDPRTEPGSPAVQADSLWSEPPGKPRLTLWTLTNRGQCGLWCYRGSWQSRDRASACCISKPEIKWKQKTIAPGIVLFSPSLLVWVRQAWSLHGKVCHVALQCRDGQDVLREPPRGAWCPQDSPQRTEKAPGLAADLTVHTTECSPVVSTQGAGRQMVKVSSGTWSGESSP